jgi:SsrA-binding protein
VSENPKGGRKVVITNKRARRNYDILETFEAGIVLVGSEVKSLRAAQAELKDAYATFRDGELWLENMHIAPYTFARAGGHDPERPRKLLLRKREIQRLIGKIAEQGLTLVPLNIYFTHGLAKVELGLGKGRRTFDKRQKLKEKEMAREMQRAQRYR